MGQAWTLLTLDAFKRSVRVDLIVSGELDRSETVGIEDTREFFYRRRCSVYFLGLGVSPHKYVDETRWMFSLLPHFVTQCPALIGSHVVDEFVYRREAGFKRIGPDLVASELMNF